MKAQLWTLVSKIIFGDFAPTNVRDGKELLKRLGFVPAWFDKFITLFYNKGENSQGVFGNTVIDTYKAMLYAGLINDSTEEAGREGMEKAVKAARRIYMFRAFSQLLGPAGSVQPIYELTDENLDYFFFETLSHCHCHLLGTSSNLNVQGVCYYLFLFLSVCEVLVVEKKLE